MKDVCNVQTCFYNQYPFVTQAVRIAEMGDYISTKSARICIFFHRKSCQTSNCCPALHMQANKSTQNTGKRVEVASFSLQRIEHTSSRVLSSVPANQRV